MLTKERIEEFLEEYKRSRICIDTTVRATLNRTMEYEQLYNKDFIEFTKDEILKMYKDAKAISVVSLQNTNLLLKHAQNWINYQKGVNETNSGVFQTITKDELKTCVDVNKKKAIIFNRMQIDEIKSELLNITDKAIIELLFRGTGGEWCSELTYLEPEQVSKNDMCIYFKTGKKINIDDELFELLQKSFVETEMISYTPGSMKVSKVISQGIYKMRCNTLYQNSNQHDDADKERRFRWVQRKLYIIGDYLDLEKLTVSSIQNSGLLYNIRKYMDEFNMNFREFIKTDEAKQLAKRYDIYSTLYTQILQDKFGDYFE